jgi:hypothetical protein
MLAHLGRTLHVGFLNDCLFDAATALCLAASAATEPTASALSRCSPDRCPNACLTARHRQPWQASIAEGEALLADRRLSPLQRPAIVQDNDRKRRLIAHFLTMMHDCTIQSEERSHPEGGDGKVARRST